MLIYIVHPECFREYRPYEVPGPIDQRHRVQDFDY